MNIFYTMTAEITNIVRNILNEMNKEKENVQNPLKQ